MNCFSYAIINIKRAQDFYFVLYSAKYCDDDAKLKNKKTIREEKKCNGTPSEKKNHYCLFPQYYALYSFGCYLFSFYCCGHIYENTIFH